MERGNVTEFELYVRGTIAVCILEAEDIDAYLEAVDGDEAVKEWERYVGQFKREGVDVDDKEPTPFMERIWTLSAVRTDRQRSHRQTWECWLSFPLKFICCQIMCLSVCQTMTNQGG